jgi:hypothetical protein
VSRILLLPVVLAIAVLASGCSGDESATQKTPEEIAKLEAECIQNTPVNEADGLDAVSECLKRIRE